MSEVVDDVPMTGAEVRRYLAPKTRRTLDKMQQLAEAGDVRSAQVLLAYFPAPRPEGERIVIPGLHAAQSLAEKAACILQAVSAGQVSLEGGEKALRMLDILGRAIALDEITKRLEALEGSKKLKSGVEDLV